MRTTLAALATAALIASSLHAGNVDATVAKELTRLDAALGRIDAGALPADLSSMFKLSHDGLDRARSAKSPLVRLYRLRQPYISIEMLLFFDAHKSAAADMPHVVALWNERRPAYEKRHPVARGTVLMRALEQASLNRAQKLFRASLPYAKVTAPFSGAYYVAEAEGNLRFYEFVSALATGKNEPRPDAGAIGNALEALEKDTIALFESDPASRTAIPASAALKEARELYDQGLFEGASLLILESRLELSKRKQAPTHVTAAASHSDTMTTLWSEIEGEAQLDVGKMIHDDVLPLYASFFRSGS